MWSKLVTSPIALLSKISTSRPIQTLTIITLLASVVYLSIIDDYVNRINLRPGGNYTSYYHPPGSNDYKSWSLVEDSKVFDDKKIDHLALIPLNFKNYHLESKLPIIKNSIDGLTPNEKFLITKFEDYPHEVSKLDHLTDTVWSVKHSYRTNKYSEYLKQLFQRLQNIIKGAETYDIVLIFLAYSAMWFTFLQLFVEFRKIGSNFWLAFGALLSSGYAFLFALGFTNKILGLKISLRTLSEGIPFLVSAIGFNHKVQYTKPILKAINANKKKSIPDTISETVKITSWPLIRYHSLVIGAFLACSIYAPHLEGLRNFCILCSVILSLDLILNFTFFAAVLSLKAEINKVHLSLDLKDFLEEDGISANVAELVSEDDQKDNNNSSIFHKNAAVVSFKFAIIIAFFAIHVFAIGTTWLNDSSSESSLQNVIISGLSKQAAKNVKIGSNGTIITLMPVEILTNAGFFTKFEDFLMSILLKISNAIKDPLISKLLFAITILSATINAYFLNAARTHFDNIVVETSTNELLLSSSKKKFKKNEIIIPVTEKDVITNGSSVIKETQIVETDYNTSDEDSTDQRPFEELVEFLKEGKLKDLNNLEITSLVLGGKLPLYALEKQLGDTTRAVVVRRKAISKLSDCPIIDSDKLPYKHYDYDRVFGACCENVIGFIPIPLGVAGPLIIDGKPYHIPMATTEGCLVASAMRGCKAINAGGGVTTVLTQDGMTRGPCVSFPSLKRTGDCKVWLDSEEGSLIIKKLFNSTSRFARLQNIKTAMAGTLLYIRFMTTTGDAMGMNMISKGVDHALNYMIEECGWDDMDIVSVSGNYCIDKKPAALNWIDGRGKSVVAEARIPKDVVEKVLKSNVKSLVRCNINKNLIGSALAGAIGGFNAQASNLVTAIYIATGQDPAQNVESSNCITLLEESTLNGDLIISVSMPSIEVGTIGGGTILAPQNAMLELLGVKGANVENPGANAKQLARIIASAVLSAELSLLSALELGHLVQSHMQHNRKAPLVAPAPGSCIKS